MKGKRDLHKTKVIGIRLDDRERMELEERARAANLTVPSFIRQLTLEHVKGTKPRKAPPPLDLKLLSGAVGALGKIGNNLNQIAHRLNEGQEVGLNHIITATERLSIVMLALLKVIKAKSHDNQRKKQE